MVNKYNRRPNIRQLAMKRCDNVNFQTEKAFELDPSNYTAYVLIQLFNSYYVPWLKECNSAKYAVDFNARLDHLTQSLESAFPQFTNNIKGRIIQMAKRNCFRILRKLKVTIDDVRKCTSNTRHRIGHKCLRIRIHTRNMTGNMEEAYYNSNYPIQIQSNYSLYLDIPIEMNEKNTKVYIQLLLANTEQPDDDESLLASNSENSTIGSIHSETMLEVKEHQISGFTGYSHKCTIMDDTENEQVSFTINLTWDLNVTSITENIEWLEIVANNFSSALLALGTYFWRFYHSLYTALLLYEQTEINAIKCLNEVNFLLGPQQKVLLFKPLFKLIDKRVMKLDDNNEPFECCSKNCLILFKLLHSAIVTFEFVGHNDQLIVLNKLRSNPFSHLLQFNCTVLTLECMIQLQCIFIRRLFRVAKKGKLNIEQIEHYMEVLLDILIDTIKKSDIIKAHSEQKLTHIQDDLAEVIAKFFMIATNDGNDECNETTDDESNDETTDDGVDSSDDNFSSIYEEDDDDDDDDGSRNVDKSSDKLTETSLLYDNHSNFTERTFHETNELHVSEVNSDKGYHEPMDKYDKEFYEAYSKYSDMNQTDDIADDNYMLSILSPKLMEKMTNESMLTDEYYEKTMSLFRKINQHIELLRNDEE